MPKSTMAYDNWDNRVYFRRTLPNWAEYVVGCATFTNSSQSYGQSMSEVLEGRKLAILRLFPEKSLHRTPALCRLLMDSIGRFERDSIAIPGTNSFGDPSFMFIIEKSTVRTNEFKNLLRWLAIKVHSFQPVSPAVLQSGLSFAIQSWLQPEWNRAGGKLVAGENFRDKRGKIQAIDWELIVQQQELVLSLAASQAYSRPSEVDDFVRDEKALQRFISKTEKTVILGPNDRSTCFVLPSERDARIQSISSELPTTCPFSDREELSENWRLAYGYDGVRNLASRCSADTYANVQFRTGGQLFTYPLACVLEHRYMYNTRCPDDRKIVTQFLQDIVKRSTGIWANILNFASVSPARPQCNLILGGTAGDKHHFLQPTTLSQKSYHGGPSHVGSSTLAPTSTSDDSDAIANGTSPAPNQGLRPPSASTPTIGDGACTPIVPRFLSKNERIKLTFACRAAKRLQSSSSSALGCGDSSRGIFSPSGTQVPRRTPGVQKAINVTFAPRQPISDTSARATPTAPLFRKAVTSTKSAVSSTASNSAKVTTSKTAQKTKESGSTGSAKKPSTSKTKSRPIPEEEVKKVDTLIATDKLSKATATMLIAWLRNRGRAVSRAEKKSDLLEQVSSLVTQKKMVGADLLAFDQEP